MIRSHLFRCIYRSSRPSTIIKPRNSIIKPFPLHPSPIFRNQITFFNTESPVDKPVTPIKEVESEVLDLTSWRAKFFLWLGAKTKTDSLAMAFKINESTAKHVQDHLKTFTEILQVPDNFNSPRALIALHLWMLNSHLRNFPTNPNKVITDQYAMSKTIPLSRILSVEFCEEVRERAWQFYWDNFEKDLRAHTDLGLVFNSTVQDLQQTILGGCVSYDDAWNGLERIEINGEQEKALNIIDFDNIEVSPPEARNLFLGALFRNVYNVSHTITSTQIVTLFNYVARSMVHLSSFKDEEILSNNFHWLPPPTVLVTKNDYIDEETWLKMAEKADLGKKITT